MQQGVHANAELRRPEAMQRPLAVGPGVETRDQGVLRGGPSHLLRASSRRIQHRSRTALKKRSEVREFTPVRPYSACAAEFSKSSTNARASPSAKNSGHATYILILSTAPVLQFQKSVLVEDSYLLSITFEIWLNGHSYNKISHSEQGCRIPTCT
ncbi:unnamed protein product [Echinostoma caproni]|uniref:Uncharacterized protein n=1 Tax=Echinostoma caproni TaxID=27848 RepID=A0A183AS66_9TREM|nr:unnamed protein product [Echinostoma caproni]